MTRSRELGNAVPTLSEKPLGSEPDEILGPPTRVRIWYDAVPLTAPQLVRFQSLVDRRQVTGLTMNPTLLRASISDSPPDPSTIASMLMCRARECADILAQAYLGSGGTDGFVSVYAPPTATSAADRLTASCVELSSCLERPNVMIKVPALGGGPQAIEELSSRGINVNATLVFTRSQSASVIAAYSRGLERRRRQAGDGADPRLVISVFVSRVDQVCDREMRDRGSSAALLRTVTPAMANSILIAADVRDALDSLRAKTIDLLWASMRPKTSGVDELKYMHHLLWPGTILTATDEILVDFVPRLRCVPHQSSDHLALAQDVLASVSELGVDVEGLGLGLAREMLLQFSEDHRAIMPVEAA